MYLLIYQRVQYLKIYHQTTTEVHAKIVSLDFYENLGEKSFHLILFKHLKILNHLSCTNF